MDVFGTVVSVESNAIITKRDGGTYPGSRLTFRGQDGKIAEQAFHNNVLKFNPSIATALDNLNPGDSIVIVKEKKGEFWNVVDIKQAGAQEITNATPPSKPAASPSPSKGSWETPEERAARQDYIIRQSCLSNAVNFYAIGAKSKPSAKEILDVAEVFVSWVYKDGLVAVDKNPLDGMEDDLIE